MKKIAQIISLLLGIPWIIAIIWILVIQTGLNPAQTQFFTIAFVLLHFGVPMIYFMWALKVGEISDFDITKREERFGLLTVVLFKNLISLGLVVAFGSPLLLQYFLLVFIPFVVIYIITFYWKISLHMTFNTVGITLVNIVSGWAFWYLYLLLPLVLWSRYVLKKHTIAQLVAGFAVSEGIMLAIGMIYGVL